MHDVESHGPGAFHEDFGNRIRKARNAAHVFDVDAIATDREIVEKRFLFGRSEFDRLLPDHSGPDWIEHLPEGYLRNAAQD